MAVLAGRPKNFKEGTALVRCGMLLLQQGENLFDLFPIASTQKRGVQQLVALAADCMQEAGGGLVCTAPADMVVPFGQGQRCNAS